MADAVPLPTGVLETSVGVVAAGAVFTTLYVGYRIGDWMAEYNHEERAQIVSLQNCYRDKCYFLERSEHSLSNLETDGEKSNGYPNHFLLKLQPRSHGFFNKDIWLPEMWRERFSPMFNANKWISNLNEGELRSNIAECISYICLYQIERGDSEQHSYSPLHLFFEEFKTWLHKLSTIDITQERFKNIVTARIAYLVEVGNLGFFRNSYNYFGYGDKVIYPTPSQTLVSLEYKLKNIRDKMILAISRRSAREHFKDLKINIERLLYSSLNFLLHLFSDQAMPSTFILTELKHPTIPSYRKIQDTFLFTILSDFVKTPAFGVVFKLDYFKFETPNYSLDDDGEAIIVEDTTVVILKTFLGDQKGSVLVDDVIARMDKLNKDRKETEKLQWYQSDESCVSILFSSQPASIVCFLNLLFWLQKLCYFYQISDQIHALAGEGGNLLVYGKAVCGTTTGKLMERFKIDFEITKKHFKLLQAAGQHFCTAYKNDPNNFRKYSNMKQWIANLSIAESVYTEIDKSINLITRCVAEIESKMAEVNSVAYRIKLAKQIETLTSSVNEYLCIEDPSANPTLSMIPTSLALLNSNGNKSKALAINDDGPLPAIEYYCYGDNPNKKKKERKKSGKK